MQEAEVSLSVAFFYIRNNLTKEDVTVAIDGAQIKTKEQVHFDIFHFLAQNQCEKLEGDLKSWKGIYRLKGYEPKIRITSESGIGDVTTKLPDGTKLYVESKKGDAENKSSQEYKLMREAIGQLLTSEQWSEKMLPAVAVPYSNKSYELAVRWRTYPQIKQLGIHFFLIKESGDLVEI